MYSSILLLNSGVPLPGVLAFSMDVDFMSWLFLSGVWHFWSLSTRTRAGARIRRVGDFEYETVTFTEYYYHGLWVLKSRKIFVIRQLIEN